MKDTIARLAGARKVEADWKAEVAKVQAELEKTKIWQHLEQQRSYLKMAQANVVDAEIDVRAIGRNIFRETGDKVPHPAVKVKVYTVLDYTDEDAVEYAREHLPQALKLIKRTFEAAAKAIKLDFVTIRKEPRVTVARDLSKYLPLLCWEALLKEK